MEIEIDTAPDFRCGKVAINGLTRLPVTTLKLVTRGVEILADKGNNQTIFFGKSDVAVGARGFPLDAGQSAFLPVQNLGDLCFAAVDTSQSFWFTIY